MGIKDRKAADKRGLVKFRGPISPDSLEFAHIKPVLGRTLFSNKGPTFNRRDSVTLAIQLCCDRNRFPGANPDELAD